MIMALSARAEAADSSVRLFLGGAFFVSTVWGGLTAALDWLWPQVGFLACSVVVAAAMICWLWICAKGGHPKGGELLPIGGLLGFIAGLMIQAPLSQAVVAMVWAIVMLAIDSVQERLNQRKE
jgi:hypothetical protein